MKKDNEKMLAYLKRCYPNYDFKITDSPFRNDAISCAYFYKDGIKKSIYYNHELDKIISNPVDGAYIFRPPYVMHIHFIVM